MKFKKRSDKKAIGEEHNKRQRVYSYYAASSQQLNNYQRQGAKDVKHQTFKRRLRLIARNWFLVVTGAVMAVLVVYSLILKQAASLTIDGTKYRSADNYSQIVNEILGQSWLNASKVTINKDKIASEIKKSMPEASQVTVTIPILGNKPDIKITTDSALAIFSNSDNQRYVLSGKGRVLLPLGESTDNLNKLPVVSNKTGINLEEGQQFLTPAQAIALSKVIFQTNGSDKVTYEIPLQPQEVLLRDESRGSYFVRLTLDPDTIEQQYGAYLATLANTQADPPREYVDARLADKVFVK
jgi:hypothetical protein